MTVLPLKNYLYHAAAIILILYLIPSLFNFFVVFLLKIISIIIIISIISIIIIFQFFKLFRTPIVLLGVIVRGVHNVFVECLRTGGGQVLVLVFIIFFL